jgi:hypothetical protein
MTTKATITENLPTLSEKELRELRARIDFLLRGAPRPQTKTNGNGAESPALMVLEIIHKLCKDYGVESRPLSALNSGQGFNAFVEKVPQVLASLGAEEFTMIELRTLLRLALGLTLEKLTHMGVPVSASVLMNHVHRVPGVLDTHFPGYRKAGMLRLLVQ